MPFLERFCGILACNFLTLMTFVVLLANSDTSLGAYVSPTPFARPGIENFDPAEADPDGNITCVGNTYDLELPTQSHWNPNTVSLQSLCTKTQYGGGPPGQNVAGWCWSASPPRSPTSPRGYFEGEVVFDLSHGALANTQLANPRVLLGCTYRCFCSNGLSDLSIQPKTTRNINSRTGAQYPLGLTYADHAYLVSIDIVDDFIVPQTQHMGQPGAPGVLAAKVFTATQVETQVGDVTSFELSPVGVEPDNKISCKGDLPNFPLPSPYQKIYFSSLQRMCAVVGSGGDP